MVDINIFYVQIAIRFRVFMALQLLKANNSLFASILSFEKKYVDLFIFLVVMCRFHAELNMNIGTYCIFVIKINFFSF